MDFCHIAPITQIKKLEKYKTHLTLAHLVEQSFNGQHDYVHQYEKIRNDNTYVIIDNSGFEMYKQGMSYYNKEKMLEFASEIDANCIVMTDYPAENWQKTIIQATKDAPVFKEAGYETFFVPQSEIGKKEDLFKSFKWALTSRLIDYIGVSILAIPNAYGVEKDNKLQRYLSRYHFVQELNEYLERELRLTIQECQVKFNKKIHFLGMVDGPNEIELMSNLTDIIRIDSWDSSAAVWAGCCDIQFDQSPTGLEDGKNEIEVAFNYALSEDHYMCQEYINKNLAYIDGLVDNYNLRTTLTRPNRIVNPCMEVNSDIRFKAADQWEIRGDENKFLSSNQEEKVVVSPTLGIEIEKKPVKSKVRVFDLKTKEKGWTSLESEHEEMCKKYFEIATTPAFRFGEDKAIDLVESHIEKTYNLHYTNKSGDQLLDEIRSEGDLATFCKWNAIKYIRRYGKKEGSNIQDLVKAAHYIVLLIGESKREKKND